ncbi:MULTISPECIES: hypothetical protein [Methylomonas]|uniref:hypothetical protein n=1 Tax=Methylomonas TaxID=416 RepID=UPI001231C68F|nr:hypothetical protein [Methylomonas rhizoryzae]
MLTKKLFVIAIWVILGCAYLWLLNFAKFPAGSFESFAHFSFMLIGAGLVYDITAKMYAIPSFRNNWGRLLGCIGGVVLGFLMVLLGVACDAQTWLPMHLGFLFALGGVVFTVWQATKAEEVFKELQSTFG